MIRNVALAAGRRDGTGDDGAPGADGIGVAGLSAASFRLFRLVLVPLAGLGGIAAGLVVMTPIARLAADWHEGLLAWAVVAVALVARMWLSPGHLVLMGLGEVARVQRVLAVSALAGSTAAILALLWTPHLAVVLACRHIGALAGLAVTSVFAGRAVGGERAGREDLRRAWRLLFPQAWRSGLGVLIARAGFHGPGWLLAQFTGGEVLSSYLLSARLVEILNAFAIAPFYSKLPAIGRVYASAGARAMLGTARRFMALAAACVALGGVPLILVGEPLLQLLRPEARLLARPLLAVMVVGCLAERIGAMALQIQSMSNRILWHWANGIGLVVLVTVVAIGFPAVRTPALPLAYAASTLAYAGFCLVVARRFVGPDWWPQLARAIAPAVAALAVTAILVVLLAAQDGTLTAMTR